MLETYENYDLANYKGGEWECTPLHTAARSSEENDMVQLLLDKKSSVDELDVKGSTVLDYVCYNTTITNVIDIFKTICNNS
jgi:ankyrin repeat protein